MVKKKATSFDKNIYRVAPLLLVLLISGFLYWVLELKPGTCPSFTGSLSYGGQRFNGVSGDEILIDRSFVGSGYENPPFPRFVNATNVKTYDKQCRLRKLSSLKVGTQIRIVVANELSAEQQTDSVRDTLPAQLVLEQ